MGIVFNNFAIRGIDVSGYNDEIDWEKAKNAGVNFSGIRIGYGNTIDNQFKQNWVNSKGKVQRVIYFYMDYYSNHDYTNKDGRLFPSNGLSDEEWGKKQADNCWSWYKYDPDCSIVFLDIESGSPFYSPTITTAPTRVYAIAKAFLQRMDILNGKFNGIYCSLGLLSWFSSWFRNRPLWVAWYNESQTISSVIRNVSATGWTGKCLIWQYASDGDTTDDGIGDGQSLGNPYRWLDLNGWVSTEDEYKIFSNNQIVVPPTPDPDPLPNTPLYSVKVFVGGLNVRSTPEIKTGNILRTIGYVQMKIYEEKNGWGKISSTNSEWISLDSKYSIKYVGGTSGWVVTAWLGLNIRSQPNTSSKILGSLPYNTQFNVSSIDVNKWGKLYGIDGYVSLKYAKQLY